MSIQAAADLTGGEFCDSRTNRCGYVAIFRFLFQNGGHPPSWICYDLLGPPTENTWRRHWCGGRRGPCTMDVGTPPPRRI